MQKSPQNLEYVIQYHTRIGQTSHWDLMLEQKDSLKTYRLEICPDKLVNTSAKLISIFDHDKKFLTYEGTVNNGEGQVKIVERGSYSIAPESDQSFLIKFQGNLLKGSFILKQTEDDLWTLSPQKLQG